MVTEIDARLREEARRFAFRFACEQCAHREESGECSLGFPSEPERTDHLDRSPTIRFCKAFELG
ncbi:MAG: hypothetical protein JW751_05935 [Polyangiaceae bacterium]|nr:hypothetical protein [Polyangiaceae bacterium]